VGGILPFGAHSDPVFRIKLPTKLSATRCQNRQPNELSHHENLVSYNSSDITVLILKIIREMRQKIRMDSSYGSTCGLIILLLENTRQYAEHNGYGA